MGWFDGATPATDDQIASAATAGVMKFDPKTGGAVRAKSWPETIADTASLGMFAYGGPEAPEGAALGTRALYAALRSAITGGETVGADVISAGGRKIAGKPADLTVSGEASRFAQGTGTGAAFEGARPLVGRLTGETKATKAGTEAVQNARAGVTGATKGVTEAGVRGSQEQAAGKVVRSELGATAPKIDPTVINQETRASQNALSHSINAIHSDINDGYKQLFAPYNKNPVNTETITSPLHDLRQGLLDTKRMSQVSPKARKLIDDGLSIGNQDPLAAYLPGQDLTTLTSAQRRNLTASFSKFSNKKLETVPATVEQALSLQNQANDILRSATENATSKSVAASTMKAATAALEELGDKQFLNPAEKETLAALKGRTRSFYTDFGPLMRKLWRTQTPGAVGAELFEKQEPHVVEQAINSATNRGELGGLQRAFADYAAPEGAPLLGDKGVIAKLTNMDATGQLKRLYPDRYGRLSTWLDTKSAQKRLEDLVRSPYVASQASNGLRLAADSPEGKLFLKAAQESLNPTAGVPSQYRFVARWMGVYQPIEALAMGRGMMSGNPALAVSALTAFLGNTLFHRALANDAFREAYYRAITNSNVKQAVYSLSRLAMGMAVQQMKGDQIGGTDATDTPR